MGSRAKIIILKNDHWCTNRHMSTKTVPTVYQQCTNRQKTVKTAKNDHWCTNRHRSTKTVPTVYQSSKTVKTSQTAKMTIGVPIVTCLHRVRQIHKVRVCIRVRRLRPRPRPPSAFVSTVRVSCPRPPSASAEYSKPFSIV